MLCKHVERNGGVVHTAFENARSCAEYVSRYLNARRYLFGEKRMQIHQYRAARGFNLRVNQAQSRGFRELSAGELHLSIVR